MAVPSCELHVDPGLPDDELHAAVRKVCKLIVSEWADLDEKDLSISKITGGITNLLLKVCVEDKELSLDVVTVRIFGPNTDAIIDRHRELQALHHLSTCGFGAPLIGVFHNGMVQAFIDARTLDPKDLSEPKLAAAIAKEVRRFHDTDAPGHKEPQLWVDILKFMEEASALSFDDDHKQSKYQTISFVELGQEVQALKGKCDSVNAPVVFSHNDLLSGNVMYNDATGEIFLIDFEYSSYSYRGYDIANHFNEYAGFDCDFTLYPKKEDQYYFFRHYLYPTNAHKATEKELESLYVETSVYSLASHLYWALWGIIQAKNSSIDFDYLDYFFLRYNEYIKTKNERLSLIEMTK